MCPDTWPSHTDSRVHWAEKDDVLFFLAHLHADKSHPSETGLSRFERGQVLRLLVLGVKLQADDFVAQCTTELGATAMDLETALGVMEAVPGEMDAYPEVKALREYASSTLVKHVEVSDACGRLTTSGQRR
jgi:hypothetical protein